MNEPDTITIPKGTALPDNASQLKVGDKVQIGGTGTVQASDDNGLSIKVEGSLSLEAAPETPEGEVQAEPSENPQADYVSSQKGKKPVMAEA
jgi:ssDNA-binding replication factor A large subunit